MEKATYRVQGLSRQEAARLLQEHGKNVLHLNESKRLLRISHDIVTEPMFILLVVACSLYFILGEVSEGFMMTTALIFVAAISVYQEIKSANALAALQALTEPKAKIIREGVQSLVPVEEIVPGDWIVVDEGDKVPADAMVMHCNDFTVNEAILTGEAFPVEKDATKDNKIFQGTVVNSGRCVATVLNTGSYTELGKLGKSIDTYTQSKTALQVSIDVFVRRLALFGTAAFILIFIVNFLHSKDVVTSLLFGLTLAMSAIPEEIPVAFSSFMALGAHAIAKWGVITRQPQVIENLGAVNVICLDKTGTITANRMAVDTVYHFASGATTTTAQPAATTKEVLNCALLASEQSPFDAMEKAIVNAYAATGEAIPHWPVVKEYPLQGRPPMMTHVYQTDDGVLATAKGGIERLLSVCRLPGSAKEKVLSCAGQLAAKGYRVLGVAKAFFEGAVYPDNQDDFNWQFVGLLTFSDPPKPYIRSVLQTFSDAGIEVKLLTGDHLLTAASIAQSVGLNAGKNTFSGDDVLRVQEEELQVMVRESNLFYRMFPEAKLRVIKALQHGGDIVAMTGDGVNDGPALKAADIGIALGKTGTEVARQAADIILTDDDLQKITEAIRQGRKIFSNLKKAVRYIVSIHIPIILIASLPVLLGWKYPNLFTPIHVIFLELIMGPTCSIFFEREPAEPNSMQVSPRKKAVQLFQRDEILISVVQGLAITVGVLLLDYFFTKGGASLVEVRTLVFTTLLLSNIFLTFVNRSFHQPFFKTFSYKNNLALPVFLLSIGFLLLLHFVPVVQQLFGLTKVSGTNFLICFSTALVCVGWFEGYKLNLALVSPLRRTDHKHAFK